ILYKNEYRHSSWSSLIVDRLIATSSMRKDNSILCIAIDDYEYSNLFGAVQSTINDTHLATVVVRSKPQGRPTSTGFSTNHEYAVFWGNENVIIGRLPREGTKAERYPHSDKNGIFSWANFRKSGSDSNRSDRKKSFYPLYVSPEGIRIPLMKWDNSSEKWILTEETRITEKIIWPIDGAGNEKVWTCSAERAKKEISDLKLITKPDGSLEIHKKYRPNQTGALPGTWWEKPEYSASESGTKLLKSLFNDKDFDFPKSINLVVDNLRVANLCDKGIVIDFLQVLEPLVTPQSILTVKMMVAVSISSSKWVIILIQC
uniref:DNA methyltransferase n=1 Tax=Desulfosarcina cetonica TaxID=90730 RepID=UPI001C43AB60